MGEESFLLVSLDEEKSKKLAQVLSNDTSRTILELLSKKDLMTETDISKELSIPISTVHYNLSLLTKAGLLSDDNFKYSEKGKKVVHYTLSNKYVIIAPKNSNLLIDKLKELLPAVFIAVLGSISIKLFWKPLQNQAVFADTFESGQALKSAIPLAQAAVSDVSANQEVALWFLAGSIFAIAVVFIWTMFVSKKK
ncbi:MAG: helix-turn-helix domain-containing protein [archaeon]